MPVSKKGVRDYARKLKRITKEARDLDMTTRVATQKIVEAHRLRIQDAIARRLKNDGAITTGELPALRDVIRSEVDMMLNEVTVELRHAQEKAYQIASQEMASAAADLGLEAAFFTPSTDLIVAATEFGADFVQTVATTHMPKVNAILSRTALGGLTPIEAMKQIDTLIGKAGASGMSFQAEGIVRSEVMRIYSVAFNAQIEQLLKEIPNPKAVKKTWVSGPYREGRRIQHQEMDGQTVAYDEPFIAPDGTEIMFPRDPKAPANHTIRCGCQMTLDEESLTDAMIE